MSSALIEVVLAAKRKIFAHRVHVASTYEGLMEGKPSDEVNSRILAGIPREMSRIFADLPVFIQAPSVARVEEAHPFLPGQKRVVLSMPPLMIAASFISYTPVNKADASALVIVWFQNVSTPFLDDQVRPHLERLDWNSKAKDFSW
jgi:hypothetical protein